MGGTSCALWEPWDRLAELKPDVKLQYHDLGCPGWTHFSTRTISLRCDLHPFEARATLSHELIHLERGRYLRSHIRREEEAVERESAKRLIGIRELAEALAIGGDLSIAAYELEVDERCLRARLTCLHPAERGFLRKRLDGLYQTDT